MERKRGWGEIVEKVVTVKLRMCNFVIMLRVQSKLFEQTSSLRFIIQKFSVLL